MRPVIDGNAIKAELKSQSIHSTTDYKSAIMSFTHSQIISDGMEILSADLHAAMLNTLMLGMLTYRHYIPSIKRLILSCIS